MAVLWRFSAPAVLSGAMVAPVTWAAGVLLVNRPKGLEEMGVFSAAMIVQTVLLFAGGMLNGPLLSMVSNEGRQSSEALRTLNVVSTWALGVALAIPLLSFPEAAQRAFGADYQKRTFSITFSLVIVSASVIMYSSGLTRVLAAHDLLWWGVLSNALWAVMLIAIASRSVTFGAPGLAAAYTIAYVSNAIIMMPLYVARKLVPKGTLVCREAGAIWAVLAVLVALNMLEAPIHIRALACPIGLSVAGSAFFALQRRAMRVEDEGERA